jgi:UbiA prenyltransferase family protein
MSKGETIPLRRSRWKVYVLLGRVSNLPTVWTNCLAGTVLAAGTLDPSGLFFATIALSIFYIAGMFLNDAFDRSFDARYRPERPIPAGDISAREVFQIGGGLLILAEGFLAIPGLVERGVPNGETLLLGLVLGVLIVYYDYSHKSDPLSPVFMALCRVMVYMISASVVATAFDEAVLWGAAVCGAYLIGLTYVAKQENLTEVRNLWPLVFLAVPFLAYWRGIDRLDGLLAVWVVFLSWVLYSLSYLIRRNGRDIPWAVVGLIAGISLLDSLLIASTGAPIPWIALGLVGFVLTLSFQRLVPGT